jgi:uncharacterized delta-60 repeat protein
LAIYPNAGTANDGEIVVAGRVFNTSATGSSNNTFQPLVARYNPNGSLDTTFGNGAGYITIGTATHADFLSSAVTIESDGKPIIAGLDGTLALVGRLNVDGTLDSTFGTGGLVTTAMLGTSFNHAVALQADGKILAAGSSNATGGNEEFAVARFLPSEPEIGSFIASANPVTAGSSETLTVWNITDANAGATITSVVFYYYDSSGTKQILGYGTQTSPGLWTLTLTVNLAPGTYTLFAQAEDSYGIFGDPFALNLTVQ